MEQLSFRGNVLSSDMELVRSVVQSAGYFSPEEIDIAVELVQERLRIGAKSGYEFLFARQGEDVVGYCCFGPIPCTQSSYDIYWIAVRDSFRNKGIGKAILKRVEEVIAELGGTRMYVETSSRPQYLSTRSFYKCCGYEQAASFEDFYAPGDGKIIFQKLVAPNHTSSTAEAYTIEKPWSTGKVVAESGLVMANNAAG
jgi:GNAT superfamily N-acetyltransferase